LRQVDALASAMAAAVKQATQQVAAAVAGGGYGLAIASSGAARLEAASLEHAAFYALARDAAEAEAAVAGEVARPGPRAKAIALRAKVRLSRTHSGCVAASTSSFIVDDVGHGHVRV